ncbi:outer membrane lipoprotein LolB [Saccharobesus litoralis]|uniref:Outer-membrane lipoprotein LolB n=1 Tax=Saccharobesus litoralis TaxID=2172099 RepID=A0A2S0VU55_9ALTE|nr:lipoprotein insertase outer membrane protein LolB [Saccharobesus litoralis]AWB67702.1 outer membrane lipoprotein LolB [Saccharobesus litoralis]
MSKVYTIFALCVLICACTTSPKITEPTQYTRVNQIHSFTLKGKVAVINQGKRESLNFYWQQNNADYDIKFTTFLGIEVARIKGNNQSIDIIADGENYQSNEPEVLLQEVTGWPIPIRKLARWITGNYSGVVMSRHDNNKPKKVLARINESKEWVIEYASYQAHMQLLLPKKITLKQHNNRIVLALHRWQLL